MTDTANPYAPPKSTVDDVGTGAFPEAEAIRSEHLGHEASLKAVGLLYLLGGALNALGAVSMLVAAAAGGKSDGRDGIILLTLFLGLMSALALWAGWGLRTLKPKGRTPALLVSGLGLLAFPVGTVINGYILWLLLSKKGSFILSPDYAAIIAATPHLKYRTPVWIWVLLGLVALGLVAAVAIPALSR